MSYRLCEDPLFGMASAGNFDISDRPLWHVFSIDSWDYYRIDIGGKLLTNHLSTLVSFRQWNMLDQTHIVNDVKEKCCYVSSSFSNDLERCRWVCSFIQIFTADAPYYSRRLGVNANAIEYILPDFSRNRHGYVRGQPIFTVAPTVNLGRGDAKPRPGSPADGLTETAGQDGSQLSYEDRAPSESDQILYMSNERFTVPELVFNPSDIG